MSCILATDKYMWAGALDAEQTLSQSGDEKPEQERQ